MRIDTETRLSALIKEPDKCGLWLFAGDEGYLKTKYRSMLVGKLLTAEQKELDYSEFEGQYLDFDELEAALAMFPMMSERRVICISDCQPNTMKEDEMKRLCEIAADVPPSAVLIITLPDDAFDAKKGEKGSKSAKLLAVGDKVGVSALLTLRNRTDLLATVKRELKRYNAEAENLVCYAIIDACNQDMGMIVNECAKLGAYAAGSVLTKEDVAEMINTNIDEKAYIMVENIINGNPELAVKRVRNLLVGGAKPIEITAALVSGYLNLHRACSAIYSGADMTKFLADFRGSAHEFVLKKAWSQASRVSSGYSKKCLALALNADADCKSSRADPTDILVRLIGNLAAAR